MTPRPELSRLRQQVRALQTERVRLERQFLAPQRLLQGSLLQRSKVCLKPGCRCTKGQPHPPLTYLSWSAGGKTRQLYVPAQDRARVRREVEGYQRVRQARARWVKLQRELLALLDQLAAGQREAYPFGAAEL